MTAAIGDQPSNATPPSAQVVSVNREHDVAELFDTYGGLVFGIARRVTGRAEDAEEICQDIFFQFWRGDGYDPTRGTVKTWLAMRAHSRAVSRLRSDTARNRRNAASLFQTIPFDPIEDRVVRGHAGNEIRRALRELSPGQLQAIELAFFGGLTQTEISDRLGIPLGTVKSRVRLALRNLGLALTTELVPSTTLVARRQPPGTIPSEVPRLDDAVGTKMSSRSSTG